MRTVLSLAEQTHLLESQLKHFFPDGRSPGDLTSLVDRTLAKTEYCFSKIKLRGYSDEGEATFNYLHSEQYAVFLYFASNLAWKEQSNVELASKLFCLNKALNGFVCMYDTILPDIFVIVHSVGIVLGKANYANYFAVYQNVTVGSDRGHVPSFGERVVINGGSFVIGKCHLGNNVSVSARSFLLHEDIPDNSVVAGSSPKLVVKPAQRKLSDIIFH